MFITLRRLHEYGATRENTWLQPLFSRILRAHFFVGWEESRSGWEAQSLDRTRGAAAVVIMVSYRADLVIEDILRLVGSVQRGNV